DVQRLLVWLKIAGEWNIRIPFHLHFAEHFGRIAAQQVRRPTHGPQIAAAPHVPTVIIFQLHPKRAEMEPLHIQVGDVYLSVSARKMHGYRSRYAQLGPFKHGEGYPGMTNPLALGTGDEERL